MLVFYNNSESVTDSGWDSKNKLFKQHDTNLVQ